MKTAHRSHVGYRRELNEDNCRVIHYDDGTCLLIVADGMGGEIGGDIASAIAVESVERAGRPTGRDLAGNLADRIRAAHGEIRDAVDSRPELSGMGTTLVLAYIRKGLLYWAHVGDSRLYLFRDGNLMRMTEDHTVPGRLLAAGEITEEDAEIHPMRNLLLKCVGCRRCEPDSGSFLVKPGDVVLLCSDGLYGEVSADVIAGILGERGELTDRLGMLIDAALAEGGSDNITVVGAEI